MDDHSAGVSRRRVISGAIALALGLQAQSADRCRIKWLKPCSVHP